MDAMGFMHEASDHVAYAIMSNGLIFFGLKNDYVLGWGMAWFAQFLSINSESRGIFISLLWSNEGKSNGLEEIFMRPRTWSPTFALLYIKDFGVCEDESMLQGWDKYLNIKLRLSFGKPASPTSLSL